MHVIASKHNPVRRARTAGFSMVEVLVALLALSIGLLGIAGMQLTGLRANLSSSFRSQATYLSYDILDRIRANRGRKLQYNGVVVGPAVATADVVATNDIVAWKASLLATLPLGDGTVTVVGDVVTVTVQWDDTRSGGVDPALIFTTQSRI
jgi:type IV pilus assembly protein PilV